MVFVQKEGVDVELGRPVEDLEAAIFTVEGV
jgi:hypothetical protein